jgi:hypothetical protein
MLRIPAHYRQELRSRVVHKTLAHIAIHQTTGHVNSILRAGIITKDNLVQILLNVVQTLDLTKMAGTKIVIHLVLIPSVGI